MSLVPIERIENERVGYKMGGKDGDDDVVIGLALGVVVVVHICAGALIGFLVLL